MKFSLRTLVALALTFSGIVSAQEGRLKVATVDMQALFQEFYQTKQTKTKFEGEQAKVVKDRDERVARLNEVKGEVDAFQKQLGDHFSLGVRGIYRDLKTAIDDTCDYTAVLDAIAEQDPDLVPVIPGAGFPYCRLFNPGEDAIFLTDVENDGTLRSYTIPADRLSPPAKRKYAAVEFFFDQVHRVLRHRDARPPRSTGGPRGAGRWKFVPCVRGPADTTAGCAAVAGARRRAR